MFLRKIPAAAALLLAAALTAAVPAPVSAAVVEGRHSAAPASYSYEYDYGPGTQDLFWKQALVQRLGLRSADCPAGLEPDLWEETLRSLELFLPAIQADLAKVNALRASAGLPVLTADPELCASAAYRAAQIRKYRHFSHYGPSGEFLAYETARTVAGNDYIYVYENYYYELDGVRGIPLFADPAGNAGASEQGKWNTAGGRLQVLNADGERYLAGFEANGYAWLCASPVHFENLTRSGITRIGIGFSIIPDGEDGADTMVQVFE